MFKPNLKTELTKIPGSPVLREITPDIFGIAQEKSNIVIHVAAHSVSKDEMSLESDMTEVMACRETGISMLASGSVQEAHDMAIVAHVASAYLEGAPFMHFLDGVRVAHELGRLHLVEAETIKMLLNEAAVSGDASQSVPHVVDHVMEHLQHSVFHGKRYQTYEYIGSPDADKVVVAIGLPAQTLDEAMRHIHSFYHAKEGERKKVGVLKVRLLRPFDADLFLQALPASVQRICVIDQASVKKASQGPGPLFQDVTAAFHSGSSARTSMPLIVGGHVVATSMHGFNPSMALSVFHNLDQTHPQNQFILGAGSIPDAHALKFHTKTVIQTSSPLTKQVVNWSLSDLNEFDSSKGLLAEILGTHLGFCVQAYDTHSATQVKNVAGKIVSRSELRFGPLEIASQYPVAQANCVVCDNVSLLLLPQYHVVDSLAHRATLILNCPWDARELNRELTDEVKQVLIEREVEVYTIDADAIVSACSLESELARKWVLNAGVLATANDVSYRQAATHLRKAITSSFQGPSGHLLVGQLNTHKDMKAHLHKVEGLTMSSPHMLPALEHHIPAEMLPDGLLQAWSCHEDKAVMTQTSTLISTTTVTRKVHKQDLMVPYQRLLEQMFVERLHVAPCDGAHSLEQVYGHFVADLQKRRRLASQVHQILMDDSQVLHHFVLEALKEWYESRDDAKRTESTGPTLARVLKEHNVLVSEVLSHETLFVKPSNWIVGGEKWAYDLSASGIHHVIQSKENVNVLVLDTEEASFHNGAKRDLGLYAMQYGDVFVASVSLGASHTQILRAVAEADAFHGPSLILAYAPSVGDAKQAVDDGRWPLYRWSPTEDATKEAFALDSVHLKGQLTEFLRRDQQLSLMARKVPVLHAMKPSLESKLAETHEELTLDAKERLFQAQFAALTGAANGGKGNKQLDLLVLYGSDGGNASGVAEMLARKAELSGCGESRCMDANDYGSTDLLEEETHVILVLSTAGQGEDCANSKSFCEELKARTAKLPSSLNFAVFGLGDSHYWGKDTQDSAKYFCLPSRLMDAKLAELGASRICSVAMGDDQADDGYDSALQPWEDALWASLDVEIVKGLTSGAPQIVDDAIKEGSKYLRGTITEGLADLTTGKLLPEDTKLTKFHGIYQQDLRSVREERDAAGVERAYSFMIRIGVPGGVATAEQYLAMDDLCNLYANGHLKCTTRQAYQFHGVVKKNLKTTMQGINRAAMDTLAACGDVNRNVIANPQIHDSHVYKQVNDLANALNIHLKPQTSAYYEIWMDKKPVFGHIDVETLYGITYLPRKFKIAIAVPPLNDVDVFSHCCGFIAIVENGKLVGYNVTAGGGMGVTHGDHKTYPRLADVLGFVTPDQAVLVAEKIMLVQRDHGHRTNRKHARLKYTLEDMGADKYKQEVEKRAGLKMGRKRAFKFEGNMDRYGWHQGHDGLWDFGVYVENGLIVDTPVHQLKQGLREIAQWHKHTPNGQISLTANQNLIIGGVPSEKKEELQRLLTKWGIDNEQYSAMRLHSMACVALPTCALAMAESQRYLPSLVGKIEHILQDVGLTNDAITIRMTGCPNGCARPYMAEIAFVGKAPGVYNMYLGGGFAGNRLNKLYKEGVEEPEIMEILEPMLRNYAKQRNHGERFGDFLIRQKIVLPVLHGKCSYVQDAKDNDTSTPSGTTQIYW